MTFEELQKIVYDAGIVGAGGAAFTIICFTLSENFL